MRARWPASMLLSVLVHVGALAWWARLPTVLPTLPKDVKEAPKPAATPAPLSLQGGRAHPVPGLTVVWRGQEAPKPTPDPAEARPSPPLELPRSPSLPAPAPPAKPLPAPTPTPTPQPPPREPPTPIDVPEPLPRPIERPPLALPKRDEPTPVERTAEAVPKPAVPVPESPPKREETPPVDVPKHAETRPPDPPPFEPQPNLQSPKVEEMKTDAPPPPERPAAWPLTPEPARRSIAFAPNLSAILERLAKQRAERLETPPARIPPAPARTEPPPVVPLPTTDRIDPARVTPPPSAAAPRLTEEQWRRATTSRLLQPTETTKAPETPQQVLPLPQPHDVPAYPMKRLHDDGTKHARPADVPVLPPPAEGRRGPAGSAVGKPGEQAETIDALALIRKRLEAMVPFCYPTEANRRGLKGTALLRFQLDSLGYPFVMQLVTSSGHAVLDDQLETLLHLAEPYPLVEGWVVVPVTFPAAATK